MPQSDLTIPDFSARSDYAIEVQFQRGMEIPSNVFRAVSELIEVCQELDRDLARSIAASIEPVVVLEEIEAGSVRAWLSTVLKSVDDSSLSKGDWKGIVSSYLVAAKRKVLGFLDKNPTVGSPIQVNE